MITDIYKISTTEDAQGALLQLERTGRFCGMENTTIDRMEQLARALLDVACGLEEVSETELWMETKQDDAVLHLRAAAAVDLDTEDGLRALSTSGENTERDSVGGKIAGFFQELFIGQNEELHTYGYLPMPAAEDGLGEYPMVWTLSAYDDEAPRKTGWDDAAAKAVKRLADEVEIGYSSDEVKLAAHLRF